jgi:hypothetical protein
VPEGEELEADSIAGNPFWLLAGIARPERFEKLVRDLGGRILGTTWLRDHAVIPSELLAELSSNAMALGGRLLLTEKDEARLALDPEAMGSKKGSPPSHPLHSFLRVEASPEGEEVEVLLSRILALVPKTSGGD